jgi:hypothetical protein
MDARNLLDARPAAARIRTELDRYTDGPEPYLEFSFWSRTVRELNMPASLMRRAAIGSMTGDPWFGQARRGTLTAHLVQLEWIAAGNDPADLG